MQKVIIKEIRGPLGRGEKKFYAVVDSDGAEFTTFDAKVATLLPESVINVEPEIKGKYINIKSWILLEDAPGGAEQAGPSPEAARMQIGADHKVAALQIAGRLAAAGKIEQDQIETCADKLYAWLAGKSQTTAKQAKEQVDAEERTAEEAWRDMGGEGRDPDTIKNFGELFTACLADFNMQRNVVIKELGYSEQKEIGESPADCYRTISRLREESPPDPP